MGQMQGINIKSLKTSKSYVKCVRYYIIRRKLLHCQARAVYYVIRQTLLHYQAAGLLHYQAMLLHYQVVVTLSGVFITLSTNYTNCRVQQLSARASDSRLREPGFESCAAVLKCCARLCTLICTSSVSCINEFLTIESGGYMYEQPSHINYSIWLDALREVDI